FGPLDPACSRRHGGGYAGRGPQGRLAVPAADQRRNPLLLGRVPSVFLGGRLPLKRERWTATRRLHPEQPRGLNRLASASSACTPRPATNQGPAIPVG